MPPSSSTVEYTEYLAIAVRVVSVAMAVGGTLAGDSLNSCTDIKSSETVLEDLQVAVGSPEAGHMVDSHKLDVDSGMYICACLRETHKYWSLCSQ